MKKKLFVCMMAFALAFTGCGSPAGGGESASTSSSPQSDGADSSVKADSRVPESSRPAAESSSAETEAEAAESKEETPKTPDISPDDIPVSPENFADRGPDIFITLSGYKGLTRIYPDDAVITEGVYANINFSGVVEGESEPRIGMVGEDYDLKIGSGAFIPGFEDSLIGAGKGETVVFDCRFPDGYSNSELAGKNTTWTVLVNLIKADPIEVLNSVAAESIITAYPKDIYEAVVAAGAFKSEDLINTAARRWLTAKAILYKENITSETPTYQSVENMILNSMGGYKSVEAAVEAGVSADLIRYYVEYYAACRVIEDNFT